MKLDRLGPIAIALLGLGLILSTCGADAECVQGCALPIWAVRQ